MKIINEAETLSIIDASKRPLLIEPPYVRSHIPLALAKIAGRFKRAGVVPIFRRAVPLNGEFDAIFITGLFTYNFYKILREIKAAQYYDVPIVLGGDVASLLADKFESVGSGFMFQGYSKELDNEIPDYSINWQVEEPWDSFSYVYTSRGCPNKCAYCAVPKIEMPRYEMKEWRKAINSQKKSVLIEDNNLSSCSSEHIEDVLDGLSIIKQKVLFANGLDCKFITSEMAAKLARISYNGAGLRMSFDRMAEDGIFQQAVKYLNEAGIPSKKILAFVLFNFIDTPHDALYRVEECKRLGVMPYPARYEALDEMKDRYVYVGKHWTRNLANAFRQYYYSHQDYKCDFMTYLQSQKNITSEDIIKFESTKGATS